MRLVAFYCHLSFLGRGGGVGRREIEKEEGRRD